MLACIPESIGEWVKLCHINHRGPFFDTQCILYGSHVVNLHQESF